MTYERDGNRVDGQHNSRELKREIDETRSEMDQTIDALIAQLDPGALLSRAISNFTGGGSKARRKGKQAGAAVTDAGGSVLEKIRENPIPAALIGVGAAWLMMSNDDHDDLEDYATEDYGTAYGERTSWENEDDGSGLRDRARGLASSAKSGASSAASSVQSGASSVKRGASSAASSVKSGASSAASSMKQGASSAGSAVKRSTSRATAAAKSGARTTRRQAKRGAQASVEAFQQALESQPLAVGAAACGVGLLCGLLIPETQREHEMLGEYRDDLLEKGRETAQEAVQRGKQVANETLSETKGKLAEEGLSPKQLAEKAKRVATEAQKAAEDQLEEEDLTPSDVKKKVERTAEHATSTAKDETKSQAEESRSTNS